MSEYIVDVEEPSGASERTSVYVRLLEHAGQIVLFRLSVRERPVCRTCHNDSISCGLQAQCAHTLVVGLQSAVSLQLYTVERLNNIRGCIV
jgi:hypothetical protein